MSSPRLPQNLFLATVLVAGANAAHEYPLLPDCLASHFNAAGMANGWQTKPAFFTAYAVSVFLAAFMFLGLPYLIAVLPASLINLPHKDYWLAPERSAETFAFFKRHFAWFGCAVLFLEVFAMESAIRANLHATHRVPSGPFFFFLAAFVLFTVFWILRLHRRFAHAR